MGENKGRLVGKIKIVANSCFENLNSTFVARLLRLALEEWDSCYDDLHSLHRPCIRYHRATSREVPKQLTSISEAFIHLDMSTAGRDIRRFNYVCKLLRLLLCDKLAFLSGQAQKHVFSIMEEMVIDVIQSQNNVAEMRLLVGFAAQALNDHRWDHIGSSRLWNAHHTSVNRMNAKLRKFKVKERKSDGKMTFGALPEECKRHILVSLPDHRDVLHLGATDSTNHNISNDTLLWKQLCFFHFNNRQIMTFVNMNAEERDVDWKYVYRRCYLRFGQKAVYSDMLAICRHCNNIFWNSLGHPCSSELTPSCLSLKPEEFIALFQF